VKHRRTTRSLLALLGLAALLVTAACGGGGGPAPEASDQSWGAVQQRAESQGLVRFYSVAPPVLNDRLVEAFNERYPDIKVEVTRGASELPTRLNAELESGADGADVFQYASRSWFQEHQSALLPVNSPNASSWADDGWAVPTSAPLTSIQPFGMIVWNTKVFPQGFSSWQDLLRPEVQGKLAMRAVVDKVNAGLLQYLSQTQGEQYLQELSAQNPKFYPSLVPLTQAVASGEVGVGASTTPSVVADLKAKGAPIEATDQDIYAIPYTMTALAKSQRPDAARVFVDFALSKEGQEAINGDSFGGSLLSGTPGALDTSSMSVLDESQFPPEALQQWDTRFRETFRGAS
jgi:iron(III) transport system substrate-binding protein